MSDPLHNPDAPHWPAWDEAMSNVEQHAHTYWDDGLCERHVDGVLTNLAVGEPLSHDRPEDVAR